MAAQSRAAPPPARSLPRIAVQVLCFAIAALEGYDVQALGIAAPEMGPSLRLSFPEIGFAASATMAAMGLGAFVGGSLADRVGRRLVLLVSVATFGLASALTAWVGNSLTLDLARVATGLGLGGAMPNLIAASAEASAADRRAAAVTMVSAGLPAGGAVCALVGRVGSGAIPWPGIFLIGGLITLPVAPWISLLGTTGDGRPASASAVRGDPRELFREGRSAATVLLWIAICLTMTILSAMTTWLPTLVIQKGQSHANGALAAFVSGASGILGGFTLGRPMDRFGFLRPLVALFAMVALSAGALAMASGAAALLASSAAAGFSCCAAQFGLYALFPGYYPPTARSTGSGAGVAAGRVGSILGPLLCGVLLGRGAGPGLVVATLIPAAFGAGSAVIGLRLFGRPFQESRPAL